MASKKHPAAAAVATTLRLLYLLLAVGVFLADRLTKTLIESTMALNQSRMVIPGFFHIVYARNQGIAFSLFADSPSATKTFLLVLLSSVALAGVGFLLWTADHSDTALSAGLSLILGGALGNLFDRVQSGSVVDFLDFSVSTYHWPAFNLADSAIVIGGGLLLLHMLKGRETAMNADKHRF
ncbi:MAG: signal peptidase II [Acidobacteria bacterium]|nr:signal peptidase II [Acidobacteriota bacterium]